MPTSQKPTVTVNPGKKNERKFEGRVVSEPQSLMHGLGSGLAEMAGEAITKRKKKNQEAGK